jgi:hypothetical protein
LAGDGYILNIFIIMLTSKLNVLILVIMSSFQLHCVKLFTFIVVFLIYKLITEILIANIRTKRYNN